MPAVFLACEKAAGKDARDFLPFRKRSVAPIQGACIQRAPCRRTADAGWKRLSLLFAFVAGLASVLSPCTVPLVPLIPVGATVAGRGSILALLFALALTFGLVGGALVSAGVELGAASVRQPASILMIALGLLLIALALSDRARASMRRIWIVQLYPLAGVILALAWAPCVGPTLGAALGSAAAGRAVPQAIASMIVFALGAALSLLIIGIGLGRVFRSLLFRSERIARLGRLGTGAAFLVIGLMVTLGLDRRVEEAAIDAMPQWLIQASTRF
jgi:cytochrome c-type biogenesis protein